MTRRSSSCWRCRGRTWWSIEPVVDEIEQVVHALLRVNRSRRQSCGWGFEGCLPQIHQHFAVVEEQADAGCADVDFEQPRPQHMVALRHAIRTNKPARRER